MVWIKRNLFFVISAAVGLLLTGFCAYLLSTSLSANNAVSDDYKTTLSSLQDLQKKTPEPSAANIQAAKADQARVRTFLNDFRQAFVPFPTPPHVDERGFKTHLEESLVRWKQEATNAGVAFPPDYSFGWSGQVGKLTYPAESIGPWMQQMEEENVILGILYQAKINFFQQFQRPPVGDETGGGAADYLGSTTVSNTWGSVTPYRVAFRGFSTELAAVLDGFAHSTNCFIVKEIEVTQSKAELPVVVPPPSPTAPQITYLPAPEYQNPRFGDRRRGPYPGAFRQPQMQVGVPGPAAPARPMTILSENPLFVTIVVDVVKLAPAH